jgi:hypothetical protein
LVKKSQKLGATTTKQNRKQERKTNIITMDASPTVIDVESDCLNVKNGPTDDSNRHCIDLTRSEPTSPITVTEEAGAQTDKDVVFGRGVEHLYQNMEFFEWLKQNLRVNLKIGETTRNSRILLGLAESWAKETKGRFFIGSRVVDPVLQHNHQLFMYIRNLTRRLGLVVPRTPGTDSSTGVPNKKR